MATREDLRPSSFRVPLDGQSGRETTRSPTSVEQFYKIETIVYGTCNKNDEHLFVSGVMRKRAIDSFSFFRPAPAIQKKSECLQ